jgi:transglutaminase-like putative cysteine protease
MKKWMTSLLAFALLLAAPSVWKSMSPSAPVFAAAGTASETQLQKDITQALNQRLSSFQVTYSGKWASLKKDISSGWTDALNSDDYLHYIVKSYSYKATSKGNIVTVVFSFTYWETLAQTNEVTNRVTQVLGQILTPGMNDHEKEKAIHDWIVSHIAYDERLVSHSAYDGLMKGRTVCQGYALLTYTMMKQAGIPVRIVEGTSRGIAHTWNLVQIGGKWYQLDCTWDDPVPDVAGRVTYNYYNLTDAELRMDHSWKVTASYPLAATSYDQVLTSLTLTGSSETPFYKDLYNQIGYTYLEDAHTASNLLSLTDKIRSAVDNGQKGLVIRYTKGAAATSDMKKAFAALQGLSSYSYTLEPCTRTPMNDRLIRMTFVYRK